MKELIMTYQIYPMSPRMKETIVKKEKKYPYDILMMGQSFTVPYGVCSEATLCNSAYLAGKKLGKRFRVIDHGKAIGYEVAYIDDRPKKEDAKSNDWNKSLEPTGAEKFKKMGF